MPWIRSCLCHQEKRKPPTISPPVHLMLKPESSSGPSHAFRTKIFKKPRPCHLCHQPILNEGSCCRVCKYVCHKICESKESADRFTDTSWQIHRQWRSGSKNSFPGEQQNHVTTNSISDDDMYDKVKICDKHNGTINGTLRTSTDKTATLERLEPEFRKIIHIETVQTTCENVKAKEQADVISHTHEGPSSNGTGTSKMLPSSYSANSYGETLTRQPQKVRSGTSTSGVGMDLTYVTERIIALWFPSNISKNSYNQGQRHVAHMLQNKHGNNYMVFNLSEPRSCLRNEHKNVKEVGWPPKLAPPLERLCSVCKEIESWLSGDQHRIAVLHVWGTKDMLGIVVAAYMHYSSICGTSDQALDRFSMRRFLDDNIGSFRLPSNKRYVDYFAGLLSHNIKVNAAPLYLTHVTVFGAPSFYQGGCNAFLKLYEGLTPIYTSGIYSVANGVKQFTVNIAAEHRPGLQLRGDILIKCYHRGPSTRETIFACQFHTCAVADYTLSFTRQELDVACNDSRFPPDGAVELHFSAGSEGRFSAPAPTPAVPVTLADDPITRADSPLHLVGSDEEQDDSDAENVNHTFGPLDGSIYATIAKKSELSPGAVSSPLTVSMDSGISSAGHQQNANTNASSSPPLTAQPSPLTPEDQHRELDELLTDMMLTVQSIPDVKPRQYSPSANGDNLNLENVRYIDEEEDKNIPYHARQDSRPFSYGINSSMIAESKGLSSPSLVRKASFNKSSGDTLKKVQTQVFPETYSSKNSTYSSNYSSSNYNPSSKYSTYSSTTSTLKNDPIDDIFTESALNSNGHVPYKRECRNEYYKDEIKRHDPLKRSYTDGSLRRSPVRNDTYKSPASLVASPYSDSESLSPSTDFRTSVKSPDLSETYNNGNLTWLQRQQLKLKERREMQLREERQPHETRLLSELKHVQSRHFRPSASHRADGYTSDTTAFADDDEDFSIPLHINTRNTANRNTNIHYNTRRELYNSVNERPFMTVKRQHEKYSQSSSPATALTTNSHGFIVRPPSRNGDSTDGLLSLVEQDQYKKSAPSHNSSTLYREESLSSWRTQSVSELESSPPHSTSSRPQTPAFPVHPRTPYTNASTPTVHFDLSSERLPPRSPTTQRRLSFPTAALKSIIRGSNSIESKDRPMSPNDLTTEYSSQITRHVSMTPPLHSSNYNVKETTSESYEHVAKSPLHNGSASPTIYYGNSRRNSNHSESPQEVSPVHVKFVRDTSKYWYKSNISREEAISMLRNQAPGTFVVRDSNSFPGAFGLALKVSTLPSNIQAKIANSDEYVRHFLIEPTSRGVRLKGCADEPVFSSLSALIYQHSITKMALPCRLTLPEGEIRLSDNLSNPAQILYSQGAACNVLYLFSFDTESLTGPQAIKKAVMQIFQKTPLPSAIIVHFKVNGQGITLTDHKRKLFFRKHYSINAVSYCGLDPEEHRWNASRENEEAPNSSNKIFGFVARKPASNTDNQCHLFAEYEPEQPATAIVNFVNKILNSSATKANIV